MHPEIPPTEHYPLAAMNAPLLHFVHVRLSEHSEQFGIMSSHDTQFITS